jgi:hypothetical protein
MLSNVFIKVSDPPVEQPIPGPMTLQPVLLDQGFSFWKIRLVPVAKIAQWPRVGIKHNSSQNPAAAIDQLASGKPMSQKTVATATGTNADASAEAKKRTPTRIWQLPDISEVPEMSE